MKSLSRLMLTAVLALLSPCLFAHAGHAELGSLAHEMTHASWMIFLGMVLLAVVFFASTAGLLAEDEISPEQESE